MTSFLLINREFEVICFRRCLHELKNTYKIGCYGVIAKELLEGKVQHWQVINIDYIHPGPPKCKTVAHL